MIRSAVRAATIAIVAIAALVVAAGRQCGTRGPDVGHARRIAS